MKKHVQSRQRIIDFWSIPHFLFGSVTALVATVVGIPASRAFVATFVMAILWEVFEDRMKIGENLKNVIADITLPLIAFPATFLYATEVAVDLERRVSLLSVVSILFFYINFKAWKARFSRDRDFMN